MGGFFIIVGQFVCLWFSTKQSAPSATSYLRVFLVVRGIDRGVDIWRIGDDEEHLTDTESLDIVSAVDLLRNSSPSVRQSFSITAERDSTHTTITWPRPGVIHVQLLLYTIHVLQDSQNIQTFSCTPTFPSQNRSLFNTAEPDLQPREQYVSIMCKRVFRLHLSQWFLIIGCC